jgi:hypothetical protein
VKTTCSKYSACSQSPICSWFVSETGSYNRVLVVNTVCDKTWASCEKCPLVVVQSLIVIRSIPCQSGWHPRDYSKNMNWRTTQHPTFIGVCFRRGAENPNGKQYHKTPHKTHQKLNLLCTRTTPASQTEAPLFLVLGNKSAVTLSWDRHRRHCKIVGDGWNVLMCWWVWYEGDVLMAVLMCWRWSWWWAGVLMCQRVDCSWLHWFGVLVVDAFRFLFCFNLVNRFWF